MVAGLSTGGAEPVGVEVEEDRGDSTLWSVLPIHATAPPTVTARAMVTIAAEVLGLSRPDAPQLDRGVPQGVIPPLWPLPVVVEVPSPENQSRGTDVVEPVMGSPSLRGRSAIRPRRSASS